MKDSPVSALDRVRSLLELADEQLSKHEFASAERLAVSALASPLLTFPQKGATLDSNTLHEVALAHCILGACAAATRRKDDALTHFEKARSIAEISSDLSILARALNGLALLQRQDPGRATEIADRARELAERSKDKTQLAKAHNTLGSIHTELADYEAGIQHYQRAVAFAEELRDESTVATYLANLGNAERVRGGYEAALSALTRALTISEHVPQRSIRLRVLHQAGELHSALAHYETALDLFRDARAIATELEAKRDLANLDLSTGIVYSAIADHANALDHFDRALKYLEHIGDKHGVATCLDNIGGVYWSLRNYTRSLEYYTRALAIAEKIGADSLIANELGNCGIVYNDMGEHQRAVEYLLRADRLSLRMGDDYQRVHWLFGIAQARQKLGDLASALTGFLETLQLRREKLKSDDGIAETLIAIGSVLREQSKASAAIPYLTEAQEIADKLQEKKFEADAHRELASTYAATEDSRLAYKHHVRFHELERLIFSEASQRRIELFHIRVAVAEKEREAELHRLRAERSEHDLANTIVQLLEQSELLQKIRDELSEVVRTMSAATDSRSGAWDRSLQALKEKLKELPSKSVDWTKLEMQFSQVHPNFRSTLLTKYPTLTKQELKMCILARIGIKTVDMAKLLYLSERTIDSHRLSLRKKIGLEKNESLTAFLAAQAPN